MEKNKTNMTKMLAMGGIMISLGTLLSLIPIFSLPFGGSVTLFSMAPVMLCAYFYGVKFGLICGTVFGFVQAIIGGLSYGVFASQKWYGFLLVLFLDYVIAYASMGFTGIFRKKIRSQRLSLAVGAVLSGFIRLCCHFLSGVIIWGSYAESTLEGFEFGRRLLEKYSGNELIAIYSVLYNSSFLVPEMIITIAVLVALISIKPVKKMSFNI